jgi:predicted Ser/Thr protein kinase
MSELRACPRCGTRLADDAPDGLCPECLLRMGLERPSGWEGEPASGAADYQPTSLPPDLEDLAARFPQLEILERIGQGGMGVVYRARQKELDRIVALKILRPEFEHDSTFAERFVREARALAKLSHPAIVTLHDFGRNDSFYYFIMEYIEGTNLRQLQRSGTLEPTRALSMVPPICEALQYAHDQGVVHRDIKPENILVNKQGQIKIADFGLAKVVGTAPDSNTLTGTWQVMGTPHYMAPEQMKGSHSVDHRADIYSLGVMIYEMLTGELPIGRFALPSQKVKLDIRLDDVVLRAMELEPERRYQRASEVKTDVEAIGDPGTGDQHRGEEPGHSKDSEHSFSETWGMLGIVLLAFLLILVGLGVAGVGGTSGHRQFAEVLKVGAEVTDYWVITLQVVGAVMVLAGATLVIGWYSMLFVLVGIAMWLWESSWVLAGLGVPWFVLGLRVTEQLERERVGKREGEDARLGLLIHVTTSSLASVALTVYGTFLSQSLWPALALFSVLGGVLAAELVGRARRKIEVSSEVPGTDRPESVAFARLPASIGLVLRSGWKECWNFCAVRFRGLARLVLLVLYLVTFVMFFSSERTSRSTDDGSPHPRTETRIGAPAPWFEQWSQNDVGGEFRINLLTPAWLIAAAAYGLLALAWRIRPPSEIFNAWEHPVIHMVIWYLLAMAAVLLVFIEPAWSVEPRPAYGWIALTFGLWIVLAIFGITAARRYVLRQGMRESA